MNTEIATKSKDTDTGVIPREWSVLNVGKIGRVVTGKTPPTNNPEYYGDDYPFVKIPDMTDSVYVNKTNTRISQKGADYLGKAKIPKNSIMVSCIATIGNVGITSEDSFTNQQINSLIPNKDVADFKYLYYFFKLNKELLESLGGGGSVYTNISKSKFESMPVVLPGIREQKNISEILSSLDDKIELNRKINSNLEKIASLLFKQWFIDFEFPNENGEPYKSSGGKMNDSELGEIPKGWRIGKLKELIVKNNGQFKKQREWIDKNIIDLSVMPNFSICIEQFSDGIKFSTNIKSLKKYDLLFGSIRPYFGKVGFSPIDGGVAGTVFSFLPKHKDFYSFILSIVSSRVFIDYTVQNSRGTKMPVINWNDMVDYNVVIPKLETVADFNNIVFGFIEMMRSNIEENMKLSRLRNLLLPRLMNGKLRVK